MRNGMGYEDPMQEVPKQEATERVGQCQTSGREKASSTMPSPPPVTTSSSRTTGSDLASLWPSLEEDISASPMSKELEEERSPITPTDLLIPMVEATQEDAGVGAKESPLVAGKAEQTIAV